MFYLGGDQSHTKAEIFGGQEEIQRGFKAVWHQGNELRPEKVIYCFLYILFGPFVTAAVGFNFTLYIENICQLGLGYSVSY